MILAYYKDNPSLDFPTVETYKGLTEYRMNCRKVKDKYYIKDVDIFFIDKIWYILDNGNIEFDHEKKRYVVKKYTMLSHGVVDITSNRELVFGYFSPNNYNNCRVLTESHSEVNCISDNLLTNNGYSLINVGTNLYMETAKCPKKYLDIVNTSNNQRNTYNIEDNQEQFERSKKLYADYKLPIEKSILKFSKYLGDTTFGAELECIKGYASRNTLNKHGVVVCRDGSLQADDGSQGPEYVTVPLQGAKGIQNLKTLSETLTKTNIINYKCALHFHLGNIRTDRTFMVALYKLGCFIQNDLFKMFPYYKNDEIKYAGKQKNYCKKLKSFIPNYSGAGKEDFTKYINNYYGAIFSWLVDGRAIPTINLNRGMRHPQNQKWERQARYHWINFMNLFFDNRNTIEFRLHTPTTNPHKIINWLYIIRAIILYADKHTEEIIKGVKPTMKKVLNVYGEVYNDNASKELSEILFGYYKSRCDEFASHTAKENYVPLEELTGDKNYSTPFKTI
jgi:hypothetical protein